MWITSTDVDFFSSCSLPDTTSVPDVVAAVALSLIELSVFDSHVLVPEEVVEGAAAVLN